MYTTKSEMHEYRHTEQKLTQDSRNM